MASDPEQKRATVLFFTISDFGYSNVVLATVYELLRQNQVDIHVASFPPLQPRLDALVLQVKNETAVSETPTAGVQFHNITEFPGVFTWAATTKHRNKADVPHPPGRKGAEKVAALILRALAIMEPDEYLSLYDWSSQLTVKLDPALIVVDPILVPIHDMARTLKRKYAVLHPWNVADGLIPQEPWLAAYWKYPAFATGFTYPVPWSNMLENIYCYLNAKKCQSHSSVKALNQARYKRDIRGDLGSFTPWVKKIPQITPSLPELDLPMNIPSNVYSCGPILLPSIPLATADPDLFEWLQKRPTILVSLGTHFEAYADTIKEQALGLRLLLEARHDVQVLWKLKREVSSEKIGSQNLHQILGSEIQQDRVRIVDWLKADPTAFLDSGHIVCSVHHGGANSYFEAAWAGVPQVVLSMWYDTFDYATRVEYLGIGTYGNREIGKNYVMNSDAQSPPILVDGKEFGVALLKTVGKDKDDASPMRAKAAELAKICQQKSGRGESAKIITDLCFE